MIAPRHFTPAEFLHRLSDASVISRYDYFAQRAGLLTSFDDVLDERLAGNPVKRLARKSRRGVARRMMPRTRFIRAPAFPG
jgi:hypothetical protein